MEFYQLRTFLTVAEEGHLTRAAEKLFTSQPAVSTHIRALEDELGVRLFDRSAKGMTLTSAGQALQTEARRIVEATRQFKQQAETLRNTVAGELVLGLNNQPDLLKLVPILHRLTQAHPELRYDMVTGSSGMILQGIDEGSLGIGFFEGACTNPRIASDPLSQIELCLVAPAEWEDDFSNADWKAFEARPWIFVSPTCSYYRIIEHICREQGLQIQPRFRAHECMTGLNLVADGLGMTVSSRTLVEMYPQRQKLQVLPHFRASVLLSLGYLSSRAEDPVIRAVRDAVREVWSGTDKSAPVISFSLEETPSRVSSRRPRLARGKERRS